MINSSLRLLLSNKTSNIKNAVNLSRMFCSTTTSGAFPIKPIVPSLSQLIYDKPLRRVLFNVPGSDKRKVAKAVLLSNKIDSIVLDIEDGVAINAKQEARDEIARSVQNDTYVTSEVLVRVNGVDSGLLEDDLKMISTIASYIDGLVIPKVDDPSHLIYITEILRHVYGVKNLKLLASIESARSLISLKEICRYAPPGSDANLLDALIFASEDYCADTGITRTPEATELLYARSSVTTHAIAHGLQAIDMVCINYKDPEYLRREVQEGIRMGFHGKQAIHPNQIDVIRDAYRPSPKQFEFASRIVEQNEIFQAQGKGAFEVDGKMIDMPMVKWAKNILSIESFYPQREDASTDQWLPNNEAEQQQK
ncbi:citrate lyase subunit beta-like protein [Heterostelium album PN500]|uniref:Citrate lyase subunit beta-like protein n=1 Tax=Heterostelium pallidum (strain ATCC 26659 / Pp 5 / PN500) TaxID=670386 RepID=D3BGD8_HETP5|nr:citrate lyase subunit beta-like protein [Heterostelium album PN500]EFA79538.1 citrate lyase subunit beta-like protein [Heterostelium album PN500]|eukprot:XP_020431659.1 citrate lyase subunit beta-like protein [Heterostelium album PN500]